MHWFDKQFLIEVIAECGSGEEMISLYEQYIPDLVIMDTHLPRKNRVETVRELIALYPQAKVLMFSVSPESSLVIESIKNGSVGYMLKEMDIPAIVNALKTVYKGGVYLHPKVTGDVIAAFIQLKTEDANTAFSQSAVQRPYHLLTRRGTEVMQLLAE